MTGPPKSLAAGKMWFEENRAEYEASVKEPCREVLLDIQRRITPEAPGYGFPKQGFGRLYRDPRKAKERGPFKNWTGALIAPPSQSLYEQPPGVWFQIGSERGDIFVSGGLYMPSATQLRLLRAAFDSAWVRRWEGFLNSRRITANYDPDHGSSLKTWPRGYDRDHPKMKWLKMTQFYLWRGYTQAEAVQSSFSARVAKDMVPILRFNELLNEVLLPSSAAKRAGSIATRRERIHPDRDVATRLEIAGIQAPRRDFDF